MRLVLTIVFVIIMLPIDRVNDCFTGSGLHTNTAISIGVLLPLLILALVGIGLLLLRFYKSHNKHNVSAAIDNNSKY